MASSSRFRSRTAAVVIPPAALEGMLEVPDRAKAAIVFAPGSGSHRRSPRDRELAGALHQAGLATLLCDLLTAAEASDTDTLFDIALLAQRLEAAIHCVSSHPATAGLPLGLFGTGTGAAAALLAAAARPGTVEAVVARGGRPDLAGADCLGSLAAPTLLIVGGRDRAVLQANTEARARMGCPAELAVVSGATYLCEEPGALEQVGRLAADWFRRWLVAELRHAGR